MLRGILAIAEQKIRRAWLSLSLSFLQLRNASDAELAVATMATLVMAAPMSLFMMLSLLSSQFPQAWPCKLPFLNNSPISCFNQGCGQFSCSGKLDFNSFIFCLWQCLTYRHGGGRGHPHQPVTAAAILSKVFLVTLTPIICPFLKQWGGGQL